MALSIDPITFVIFIPKADLTLVQVSPTEIRELDLNAFRLELKAYEDDEDGMYLPKTHEHNTEVTLAGLTFARVIEILPPYSITFEDGQYAVNLVGANSNVADKVNVNQVSVRSANSAGLISSPDIEYSSFNGGVTINTATGISGTTYPIGTERQPVDNLTDAILIDNYRGFGKFYVQSDMTLDSGSDISNKIIEGKSHTDTQIIFDTNANTQNIIVNKADVSGVLDGGTTLENCLVGDLVFFNGHIHDSGLYGTIYLDGNEAAVMDNCITIDQSTIPEIDLGETGQSLSMPNYSGMITLSNCSDATANIGIGLNAGVVILDSTITAGNFIISGTGLLVNNSTSTTTLNTDGLINSEEISQAVWDESMADHIETGTAGKVLSLTEYDGVITVDATNGTSGTAFPLGTRKHPVDNIADAITIGNASNLFKIRIIGSLTLDGEDITGYTLLADRSVGNTLTITSMINTAYSYFQDLTISGALSGGTRFTTCVMGNITGFDGGAKNCLITGTLEVTGTGANYLTDCDTYVTAMGAPKELSIGANYLNLIRCRGSYKIADKTGTNTTSIDLVAGGILVDSTCTAGIIAINGIADVVDNSGAGCTVVNKAINQDEIANVVWDEAIADHADTGSTGEALGNVSAGADPATIADAVWDEAVTGHDSSGTFGQKVDKKLLTTGKFVALK